MLKPTLLISILLLSAALAPAQTPLPARQVSANTNGWESLAPAAATAQSAFDWIDANWRPALVPGTNVLISSAGWQALLNSYGDITSAIPTNATAQSALDSADEWVKGLFDALEAIPAFEPDAFYFVRDTNLTSVSNWGVLRTNWAGSGVASNLWPANVSGTNEMVLFTHPPFVVADDIMFPDFVTKEQFYAALNAMGFANLFTYSFHSYELYGSAANPPDDNQAFIDAGQYWTVPDDLNPGQEIEIHCWGGGHPHYSILDEGLSGGYSFGVLTVHGATETTNVVGEVTNIVAAFASTNAGHVTNGMRLAVHVGYGSGRAAVWRIDSANYNAYDNELIVAGGPGSGGGSLSEGGFGGGTNGGDGLTAGYSGKGGSQTNGGAADGSTIYATAGARVWGGTNSLDGIYDVNGGDGYWGGGAARGNYASGGGSGYVHPQLAGVSNAPCLMDGSYPPPKISIPEYGLLAGYQGNPGRVVFVVRFTDWRN